MAAAGFGGTIIGLWVLFLLRWLAGFDLIALLTRNQPVSPMFALTLAAVGTIVLTPWGFLFTRRRLHLAQNGIEGTATISKVGSIGYAHDSVHASWPIRYTYEYNGQTYAGAADLEEKRLNELEEGDGIAVLVDPNKPQRSALMEQVLPVRVEAKPRDPRIASAR